MKTLIYVASCLAIALAIAGVFALTATWAGMYTQTDIAIGTLWFFVISFIASMPLLIPKLRSRLK